MMSSMNIGVLARRVALVALAAPLLIGGCKTKDSVVILSHALMKEQPANFGVPQQFESAAPSNDNMFWVEGKVQNTSGSDVSLVRLTFRCKAGTETRVLTAEIPKIAAGQTVEFKTRKVPSRFAMELLADQSPEIDYQ